MTTTNSAGVSLIILLLALCLRIALPAGTSDEKLDKTNEREQEYLQPGTGETDPTGPTRNYRNVRSSSFLPGGLVGWKKLSGSTKRGARKDNLAEPTIKNQRNTHPVPRIPNKKNPSESTERDQDRPSSDVETAKQNPLPPGIPNRKDYTESPLPPGPQLGGPTKSQRKTG